MSQDTTLRTRLIRLAAEKPELRPHLLPLLKEAALPLLPGYQRVTIPFPFQVEIEYPLEVDVDPEGRPAGFTSPNIREVAAYVASNPNSLGRMEIPNLSHPLLRSRANYELKKQR